MKTAPQAKRYVIRGRVQGVGFRAFVQRKAVELGVRGYTRNLDDGRVEVYAIGLPDQLAAFEGPLWKGPLWARVESVESQKSQVLQYEDFQIRR